MISDTIRRWTVKVKFNRPHVTHVVSSFVRERMKREHNLIKLHSRVHPALRFAKRVVVFGVLEWIRNGSNMYTFVGRIHSPVLSWEVFHAEDSFLGEVDVPFEGHRCNSKGGRHDGIENDKKEIATGRKKAVRYDRFTGRSFSSRIALMAEVALPKIKGCWKNLSGKTAR